MPTGKGDEKAAGWGLPELPARLVNRPALLDRLDEVLHRPVTSVTGPAGSGKSTLVAQWCRQRCAVPIVWVSLTDVENDPAQLLGKIVQGFGRLSGRELVVEDRWLAEHGTRLKPVGIDQLAAAAAGAPESVLVLDGVNSSGPVGLYVDIALSFERSRGDMRLVAIGRCIPPPEIMPLRLRGLATHLGAADLELGAAEVAEVIAAYSGRSISDAIGQKLTTRLEGWMAGAVIVGMTRPTDPDCSADDMFDVAFDGIDAYATAEVLNKISDESRQFVIRTACVSEMTPVLCDAMTGRSGSEKKLSSLRSSGFPIRRRGSPAGSFRYLGPFREVFDAHAQRDEPDARVEALRIAAEWFGAQKRPFDAAECWVRVGDWNQVANVIIVHLQQILEADEIGRLVELVEKAPPAVVHEHVSLALSGAWVLRMDGRIGAAYELLAVYESYMAPVGRMVADVTRSGVASWVEDVEGPLGFAEAAIAACDELGDEAFEHVTYSLPVHTQARTATFRTLAHGHALMACCYGGMWERGEDHLVDVAPEAVVTLQQLWIVQLHGERATFHALGGRAAEALAEARYGLIVAADSHLLDHRAAADGHYALGEALRLTLQHREAKDAFDQAQPLAEINQRRNLLAAIAASRAHMLIDNGDIDAALELLQLHRAAGHHRPPKTLAGLIAGAEARAFSLAGAHGHAIRALDLVQPTAVTATARVAVALAMGDLKRARDTVTHWPYEPTVDAAVRRALAAAAISEVMREPGPARDAMHAALTAAGNHQLLQPFIEYGPLIARLLPRAEARNVGAAALDLARQVHAAMLGGNVAGITPRFTPREAIVLSYLAEGLPLQRIANELHLSINTVKTHIKGLYRKLGVNSRAQAIKAWNASLRSTPDS